MKIQAHRIGLATTCTGGILETTADLRAVVALAGLLPWDFPLAPLGEHLLVLLLLPHLCSSPPPWQHRSSQLYSL